MGKSPKYPRLKERLEKMKTDPPQWGRRKPKTYKRYVECLVGVLEAIENSDADMAAKMVANAWVAGQDSVDEKEQ